MKGFIILSLVACALAGGYNDVYRQRSGYHAPQRSYEQPAYRPVKHEDNGCKYNGDILRNGNERCSFLECHPGNEPWYDSYGNIKLYTRERHCPPGTAVSERETKGYGNDLLFRPIQYNPTHRAGYGGGYGKGHATYTNNYMDMTAICSISSSKDCHH